MRKHLGVLLPLCVFGSGALLGAACGKVEVDPDASQTSIDAPAGDPDGAAIDAPTTAIDAPTTAIDAAVDAPSGPVPTFHWQMENSTVNTGSVSGFTLVTPANVSYGAGKIGQAVVFGGGQYSYVEGVRAQFSTYADMTIGFWLREPGTIASSSVWDCNNRGTSPYGGVQLGFSSSSVSLCVSSSSSSFLGGSCNGFTAPSANTWHHWIIRYDGTGTGAGQGGATQIYIDNVLVHTRANDANNNPVWNPGIPDRMTLGTPGVSVDDLRIYNQVFSVADQCTHVVRGTWTGSSCTLP
jgi:hypothetical protein